MAWKWILYFSIIGFVLYFGFFLMPKMVNDLSYNDYLLYVPKTEADSSGYPLMLFLHGSGERGNDLALLKKNGPPSFLDENYDFPFVVVTPQCSPDDHWHSRPLLRLLDSIESKLPIDPDRIYVTGLSMGGFGTWHLAQAAPERFAAIAPVCGGYNGSTSDLKNLADMPIWVFHGQKDDVVSINESQRIVDELQLAGAKNLKFTVYPDADHDSWTDTYNNEMLYSWMLEQRKK
jgi:predicted peptidase